MQTDIEVEFIGHDGNAFFIIGRVSKALKKAEGEDVAEQFTEQAYDCESYEALLALVNEWVIIT